LGFFQNFSKLTTISFKSSSKFPPVLVGILLMHNCKKRSSHLLSV
jgi:hypothetical protein